MIFKIVWGTIFFKTHNFKVFCLICVIWKLTQYYLAKNVTYYIQHSSCNIILILPIFFIYFNSKQTLYWSIFRFLGILMFLCYFFQKFLNEKYENIELLWSSYLLVAVFQRNFLVIYKKIFWIKIKHNITKSGNDIDESNLQKWFLLLNKNFLFFCI
jgi:hypothetical protein